VLAVLLDAAFERRQLGGHAPLVLLGVLRVHALARELQAREVLRVASELDVNATAGHVGCDRDPSRLTGLGDDLSLAFGVLGLGVEDRMRDSMPGQALGQQL